MKAKFINENKIEYLGKSIIYEGRVYTNPLHNSNLPKEALKDYKDVIDSGIPVYNYDTQYIEVFYTDGNVITKNYKVIDFAQ